MPASDPDAGLEARGAAPANGVRRALRVIPVLLFVGTMAGLVRYAAGPLVNPDTYFHLRYGHEFLGDWSLRDPGTVTPFATQDWLPTQWSTQILMAKMEDWFGLAGVAWLSGLQILLFAVVVYAAARRYAPALAASLITMLAVVACQPTLSGRPQVLSFTLIVLVTVAWLDTVSDGRARWWLVPLTWVWATVHGMWPLAIVIGVIGSVCVLLNRERTRAEGRRAALVTALCAVAAAVTPIGPALYGAVVGVGSRAEFFYEWGAPDFHKRMPILTATFLALTVLALVLGPKPRLEDVAFTALAGACTLYSIRTLPVAVAILVPILARALAPHLERVPVPRWEKVTIGAAFVGGLALLGLLLQPIDVQGERAPAVEAAVDALPADTVVVNDWALGGYFMWRFPQLDLLMHGYGDSFTDAELERNTAIVALDPGWDRLIVDVGARHALLRTDTPLTYALESVYDWEVVEESDDLVLLEAPDSWPDTVDD